MGRFHRHVARIVLSFLALGSFMSHVEGLKLEFVHPTSTWLQLQFLDVLFDTSSANSFTFSVQCIADQAAHKTKTNFSHSKILAADVEIPSPAASTSGSVFGNLREAYVQISPETEKVLVPIVEIRTVRESSISATEHSFGGSIWNRIAHDGLIGLGVRSTVVDSSENFISRLYAQGIIHKKLFTVVVSRSESEASYINFGVLDESSAKEDIRYTAVLSDKQGWQIPLSTRLQTSSQRGIQFGTRSYCSTKHEEACSVILNTNYAYVGIPHHLYGDVLDEITLNYVCEITTSGGRKCDCSEGIDRFPLIDMFVYDEDSSETHFFRLLPEDYVIQVENWGFPMVSQLPESFGESIFVLGMPFLRTYVSVFDQDRMSVGFSRVVNPMFNGTSITRPVSDVDWALSTMIVGGICLFLLLLIVSRAFYRKSAKRIAKRGTCSKVEVISLDNTPLDIGCECITDSVESSQARVLEFEREDDTQRMLTDTDEYQFEKDRQQSLEPTPLVSCINDVRSIVCPICDVEAEIYEGITRVFCEGCRREYLV